MSKQKQATTRETVIADFTNQMKHDVKKFNLREKVYRLTGLDIEAVGQQAEKLQKLDAEMRFEDNNLVGVVKRLLAVSFLIDQQTEYGNGDLDGITARGFGNVVAGCAQDITRFLENAGRFTHKS